MSTGDKPKEAVPGEEAPLPATGPCTTNSCVNKFKCALMCILPFIGGLVAFDALWHVTSKYVVREADLTDPISGMTYVLSFNVLWVLPLMCGLCDRDHQQRTLTWAFMTLVNTLALASQLDSANAPYLAAAILSAVLFRLASLQFRGSSSHWKCFVDCPHGVLNAAMLVANVRPGLLHWWSEEVVERGATWW